jgi:drug/metabolite transporter (DMT)-like permease
MTPHKRLQRKTYVLLVLMVLFGSVGDVLLSKGMKQIGEVNDWSFSALAGVFQRVFASPTIWLGVSCLILFFVGYMLVLSWADFSYVLPATATSYAIVPLLGYLLLGEVVSATRWAGVAFICLGVMLVGSTPPSTTGAFKPSADELS